MDSAPGLRKSKNISIACKHYNDRLPPPPPPSPSGTSLQLQSQSTNTQSGDCRFLA
jgi:hypothetical protein